MLNSIGGTGKGEKGDSSSHCQHSLPALTASSTHCQHSPLPTSLRHPRRFSLLLQFVISTTVCSRLPPFSPPSIFLPSSRPPTVVSAFPMSKDLFVLVPLKDPFYPFKNCPPSSDLFRSSDHRGGVRLPAAVSDPHSVGRVHPTARVVFERHVLGQDVAHLRERRKGGQEKRG